MRFDKNRLFDIRPVMLTNQKCMDHKQFSSKGGSSRSEKKREAGRRNLEKAREAKRLKILHGNTEAHARTAEPYTPEEREQRTDSVKTPASTNLA
jgi:hypothetical protein